MRANVVKKWSNCYPSSLQLLRHSSHSVKHRQVIAARDPIVNAFVHVSEAPQSCLEGQPLSGKTVAIKDNIATTLSPTTCSSAMLRDFVSPFDATVVKLLQKAGADIIGKTNCDEFGMGSLNIHSIHGPVKNPAKPSRGVGGCLEERSAGGSSGGSAAAVAAGMCDAALGTDTGGSVRLPAAYCGVVGFKPSYGLVSRWGVISYADSLDCVGVFASRVETARDVFNVVASYDDLDPTAAPVGIRNMASEVVQSFLTPKQTINSVMNGLRIGIPQECFPVELSPSIVAHFRNVITQLKLRGATIVPISLPSISYALSSYYVLASAEASSNMARYDGIEYGSYVKPGPGTDLSKTSDVYAQTRSAGFGSEVQKRILLGTYALSADAFDNYFLQAQRVRQMVKDDFNRIFTAPNYFSDTPKGNDSGGVDVLLHPSAISTAPLLGNQNSADSKLGAYVQDVFTVPASLAGLPALSVPIHRSKSTSNGAEDAVDDGWPIGISVVGQWGMDRMVLAVGEAIEWLQHKSA